MPVSAIGTIPSQVLAVLIVPLLKSKVKSRDPANSGNYTPIAIATALSKVLEKVVLHRLEPTCIHWTISSDHQASCRGKNSTEETIKKTRNYRRNYSIYCNSLWSRFKVATLNRPQVCHNDILKRLLGLPRWCSSILAFARNGVNNLDVICRHSVFSLRSRVELSANSIITSVRQSSAYVCGPIQQRWLGLLFAQNVG
ncbi:hypothetical protein GWK47_046870 [Chionoecetes opilio]|uniref:Reverse transcriptase n=1 Tax=Chionoecetes opilio TaxID=41210 RepID=A0A8J5CW47_CHIOP|nr:hypothetical protein GWK47_046870 [Chionoecetes opilio]